MTENNLFQKINKVKNAIAKANLKKSWKNGFAHFTYYELGDFLPLLIEQCEKVGIFNHITFEENKAVLEIIDTDNPTQTLKYEVPTCELELKWCNKIQALWGIQTYSRRYLYITAYDICESDSFDAVVWDWDKNTEKVEVKKLTTEKSKERLENFKKECEALDLNNAEAIERQLAQWRLLHPILQESDQKELSEICVGMKEILDNKKQKQWQ